MLSQLQVEFRLDEAVQLATALAAYTAERHGIRALIIKGEATSRYGLREQRVSSDVDVLVDPERFDDFCAAIKAAGWRSRRQTLIGEEWSPHSVSYVNQRWPCDIDVHRFFPGLLADPHDAFEALWLSRREMVFAGRSVDVPDRAGSAIILALHSLRDGPSHPRHSRELDELLKSSFDQLELTELADLIREVGAEGTLSGVLNPLGLSAHFGEAVETDDLRAWRSRVEADSTRAYFWLVKLRREPWRRKPHVFLRALWPSRSDLVSGYPDMPDAPRQRVRTRIVRLSAGFKGLPTALRALRRNR